MAWSQAEPLKPATSKSVARLERVAVLNPEPQFIHLENGPDVFHC